MNRLAALALLLCPTLLWAQPTRPYFTVLGPTPAKMAQLCGGTEDLAECGKRVEADQIRQAPPAVERRGKVLAIELVDGTKVYFANSGGAEGGEAFAFYGYHAESELVVLYHNKADKLDFFAVSRNTGLGSALPNEPVFTSSATQFLTADVCSKDCEQRVVVWAVSDAGITRQQEWFAPFGVTEVAVAWTPAGKVWMDITRADGKQTLELALDDKRWNRFR
jgi:hypothetical protein